MDVCLQHHHTMAPMTRQPLDNDNDKDDNDSDDNNDDNGDDSSGSIDSVEAETWVFGFDFSKMDTAMAFHDNDDNNENNHDDNLDPPSAPPQASNAAEFALNVQRLMHVTQQDYMNTMQNSHNEAGNTEAPLWDWVGAHHGARLDALQACDDQYGGRGICAAYPISSGQVAAVLPRKLRIGQGMACRRLGLPPLTPDLTALSLLLLDSLVMSSSSPCSSSIASSSLEGTLLSSYTACLPRHCHNALFMTTKEREYWSQHGNEYDTAILRIREQGEACVRYICKCLMQQEPLLHTLPTDGAEPSDSHMIWWAISMVQSRTHGFGSSGRWLTPILDLCNHSSQPNCQLEGDSNGDIVLRAMADISKGQPITIDYQVSDDAKLVACYGFSLRHDSAPLEALP